MTDSNLIELTPQARVLNSLDDFMRHRLVVTACEANPALLEADGAASVTGLDVLELYNALAANLDLAEWVAEHPDSDSDLAMASYWAARLLTQGFAANVKRMARDILFAAEHEEYRVINRTHIMRRGT